MGDFEGAWKWRAWMVRSERERKEENCLVSLSNYFNVVAEMRACVPQYFSSLCVRKWEGERRVKFQHNLPYFAHSFRRTRVYTYTACSSACQGSHRCTHANTHIQPPPPPRSLSVRLSPPHNHPQNEALTNILYFPLHPPSIGGCTVCSLEHQP